jgi:hypothetical protein
MIRFAMRFVSSMPSIFQLLVLTSVLLFGESLEATYRVSFGVLGEMGIATARLDTQASGYEVHIEIQTTGIAKALSRNRRERHVSKGRIIRGKLRPDLYRVEKRFGDKRKFKTYRFDHLRRKISRDSLSYEKDREVDRSTTLLDYYAPNDLLTLYFNIDKLIEGKKGGARYLFKAAGAEKQQGSVEVVVPRKRALPEYRVLLGGGDVYYLKAIINQTVFLSDQGELMLAIGHDGITERAVLKDVVLFGDIKAKRIR